MNRFQDQINLLSYWHKVEAFTPHEINKDNTGKPVTGEATLPWVPRMTKIMDKEVSYHRVCIGVFYVSEANRAIDEYFGQRHVEPPNSSGVLSCFAECIFAPDGVYRPDSLKLSTMPWAIGKLMTGGEFSNDWTNEFERYRRDVTERIQRIFQGTCSYEQLQAATEILTERSRWLPSSMWKGMDSNKEKCDPLLQFTFMRKRQVTADVRERPSSSVGVEPITSTAEMNQVGIKQDGEQVQGIEEEILNSFYLRDLEKVIEAVGEGKVGKALEEYLSCNKSRTRVDVGKEPDKLREFHEIRHLRSGRWPMDKRLSLNLMQQTSVHLIHERLATEEGIFSVNGPPGTGKTTLLRDVIAGIITERADHLVSYPDPGSAFSKYIPIDNDQKLKADGEYYRYHFYELDAALMGDGIIISSSNNGAVQNVTGELPGMDAIKGYADDENARYFQDVAQFVMDDVKVWGMISAVMGNRANRSRFVDRFWFGRGESGQSGLPAIGMKKRLQDVPPEEQWNEAVAQYQQAKDRVTGIVTRMESWRAQFDEYAGEQQKLETIHGSIQALQASIDQMQRQQADYQSEIGRLHSVVVSMRELYSLEKQKYRWWQTWMWWRLKIKRHKSDLLRYQQELQDCLQEVVTVEELVRQAEREKKTLKQSFEQQCLLRQEAEKKLSALEEGIKEIPEAFQRNMPTEAYWRIEGNINWDSFQKASPWMFEELADARTQLFLKALSVHQAFVMSARKNIRNNLTLFMNYLQGQVPYSIVSQHLPTLWNTLFLVVPVVSTTFASLATMMRGLKQGDIGWLIVDEAGQAIPQAAVGGLWRARRAIIVGDPLQIEPVLTVPESMLQNFRDHYKVPNRIATQTCSVQFVADLANPIGTEVDTNAGPTWIGCPLYVHRRCLDPMFTIANEIAYSSKMVYATAGPKGDLLPQGASRWIDVNGRTPMKHWIPEQGQVVLELVRKAFQGCEPSSGPPSLYIISPFTEVVKELRRELRKSARVLCGHVSNSDYMKWVYSSIGTVHTFQGKQAETVVFCLGLDWSGQGAANWASSKPNILNVAVTRAMYRFIIVGNVNLWKKQRYFDIAYQRLNQDS